MKKVYIWDIDGTLVDTKPGIIQAINTVLKTFGRKMLSNEQADLYIGPSVREAFIKYQKMSEKEAAEATKMYRNEYVNRFIRNYRVYPGMNRDFLIRLKGMDGMLCIATMKTERQVQSLLETIGLSEVFDLVKCADEEGKYTKQAMVSDIIKAYGREGNTFYMIGDTEGDHQAAIYNRVHFIYANYGYGDVENADYTINLVEDILNIPDLK